MAIISKNNGIIKGTGNPNLDVNIQDGDTITPLIYIDYSTTPPTFYKFNDNLASGSKWVLDNTVTNADSVPFTPAGSISSTDVQSAVEEVQSNVEDIIANEVLFKTTIAELRASTATHDFVYITDNNQTGVFKYDSTDVVSTDNTGTILVSNNGRRYKRQFSGPLNVKWFGATGDGATDDFTVIQAIIDYFNGNISLYLPKGDYLVSDAIKLKSGMTIFGDGYATRVKCPDTGWLMNTEARYGIITARGADNIIIRDLRIYGTKTQDISNTPKIIYFGDLDNLKIESCFLENSAFEGIWSGDSGTPSSKVLIHGNHVKNIGYPAGAFIALPAVQPNCKDVVISNNIIEDVGSAIGPSATNITIIGNTVREFIGTGISTGDGAEAGIISITGNTVETTSKSTSTTICILADTGSSTERNITIANNNIRLVGTNLITTGRGMRVNGKAIAHIVGNHVEVNGRGTGIEVYGSASGSLAIISNNTIRCTNELGFNSGIVGLPNGSGNTTKILSSNNYVWGFTRANSSYSIDYRTAGGGTLDCNIAGDIMLEGNFRIGSANYGFGEFDNIPVYITNKTSAAVALKARQDILNINNSNNVVTLTAGAINLTGQSRSVVMLNTNEGSGIEDLNTISGTQSGDILIVSSFYTFKTITLKNGTGNLKLNSDFALDSSNDRIVLISDGTNLYEVARSDNGT